MNINLRAATAEDIEWLVELRAVVLRDDLTRLGVFDEVHVRERMRASYNPAETRIIVVDGVDAGCIVVHDEDGARWLSAFYLNPALQGQGIGTEVFQAILSEPSPYPFKLNVLNGSPARSMYERFGFTVDSADEVDVFMTLQRPAGA